MGDHDYQSTCVSAEPHEAAIRDYLQHFLGCLEFRERKDFFSPRNPIWKEDTQSTIQPEAGTTTRSRKLDTFQACLDQLRRIEYLRKAMDRDDERILVQKLGESKAAWEDSKDYQTGLFAIEKWKETAEYLNNRDRCRPVNTWGRRLDAKAQSPAAADLDTLFSEFFPGVSRGSETSNNSEIQASRSTANIPTMNGSNIETHDHYTTRGGGATGPLEEYDPEKDLNAYMVQFEEDENHSYQKTEEKETNSRSLRGHFPDQRMSVTTLLGETLKGEHGTRESARKTVRYEKPEVNYLGNDRDDGQQRIRWFHLPANNMAVSIETIPTGPYFGSDILCLETWLIVEF
jgi:hypothetical protein